MKGEIVDVSLRRDPLTVEADVCIVGTGAGGAVLGAGLAAAGQRVVFLEEGGHHTREDFTLQEGDAFPAMYQERGTRATDDLAITILQGRSVGGTTTVNWTTCFRTPERILAHWRREHGHTLTAEELAPHFEAVEARLNIHAWDPARANPNNRALLRGCEALGWEAKPLRRNVKGCADSGYCGLGCPTGAKQAMGVTYIQDALAAGATVLSRVRVARFEREGRRVVAARGRALSAQAPQPDGVDVVVKAPVFVSSGGAINGPALLLRSGLDGGGRVGRRTFLHPVVASFARYAERIQPFYGAPQSIGSHRFIDRGADKVGFFLEAAPVQPMLGATAFTVFGSPLMAMMRQLAHAGALLALSVDGLLPGDEGGTVTLKSDGRPSVAYPIGPALQESFREAHKALARVHLAAGAAEVASLHLDPVAVTAPEQVDPTYDGLPHGALEHAIFTAHQMGGVAMGSDPSRHPVDLDHRFRGVDNLFVVDGSVLPTSLGVNPSETIYGLAHRARRVVGEAV